MAGNKNDNALNSEEMQLLSVSFKNMKKELLKCISNPEEEFNKLELCLGIYSTWEGFFTPSLNLGNYYREQYNLLVALKDMCSQKPEASTDDQRILNFLRAEILTYWETTIKNSARQGEIEKNKMMLSFSKKMIKNCELAKSLVKDETSGALIKNVLLILSAILTLGLSLAAYAAITTESRAKSGHFFFHDGSSKNKIDPVKDRLEILEEGLSAAVNG